MQFSSSYVKSKWKSSSETERNKILVLAGLLVPQPGEPHFSSNQRQKSRNQKAMTNLLQAQRSSNDLEFVQLEFMHWVSHLPHLPGEAMPCVEEYPDLEAGEVIQPLRPQDRFLRWCSSHEDIGAELCEYLSFCSLLKLFSQPSGNSHPTWSWCSWASNAYSELEKQYHHHIGDSNIVALFSNDTSSSKPEKKNKIKNRKPQSSSKEPVNEVKRVNPGPQTHAKKKGKKNTTPKGLPEVPSISLQVDEISSSTTDSGTEISSTLRAPIDGSPSPPTPPSCKDPFNVIEEKTDPLSVAESFVVCTDSEIIPNLSISDENYLERTTFDSTSHRDSETGSTASSQVEDDLPVIFESHRDSSSVVVLAPLSQEPLPTVEQFVVSVEEKETPTGSQNETNPESSHLKISTPIKILGEQREPSLKNHSGDFLGTECQIFPKKAKQKDGTGLLPQTEINSTEPQRNSVSSHDSSSRIDLIQYDQQRKLTEILTEDILDMASNLYKIAQLRRPWQSAAIERVRTTVQSIWPQAQCDIFGSFGTGLAIPSSDVDIVVTGVVNQLQWWGGKPITPLAILSQHLQLQEWVSTVRAIEHTLMPVIKITTAPVPMPSIGAEARKDYRGVRNSSIVRFSPAHVVRR
jgi:hypothetical protein